MQAKVRELTNDENHEVQRILISGTAERVKQLSLVLAVAYFLYGILSFSVIKQFDESITIFNNTWPRLLFNSLPLVLLVRRLSTKANMTMADLYFSVIVYVSVFMAACLVYVWPIMYAGNHQIYFYFHAANMFIFSIGLIVIAPPARVMALYNLLFLFCMVVPVLFFLSGDPLIVQLVINDFLTAALGSSVAAHFSFKIRKQLTTLNIAVRSDITPFLGKSIADEIYRGNIGDLKDRVRTGLIMSIDIRGYTLFKKNEAPEVTAAYMKDYHSAISRIVGNNGGYIHKSNGDGYIISFGIVDEVPDLNDIPGIEDDLKKVNERRQQTYQKRAEAVFFKMVEVVDTLTEKYCITEMLSVGAALDQGEIRLHMIGDGQFRREIDIDGEVVIRVSRLEAYTKIILQGQKELSSCLILSPKFKNGSLLKSNTHFWLISDKVSAVRDFPDIKHFYYLLVKQTVQVNEIPA